VVVAWWWLVVDCVEEAREGESFHTTGKRGMDDGSLRQE
jgi:hypothetical protein